MSPNVLLDLEVAAVLFLVVLIVAVAAAASGACVRDYAGAAVQDVERALGESTLVPYAQAGKREQQRCCVWCQAEYGKADELVRVVPACGHFFHAECNVDRWIRKHRSCPLCRRALWPGRPAPRQTSVAPTAVVVVEV